MSSRTAALVGLWRIVHVELMMLAEGATSSYNSDGPGHTKPGSKSPPAVDRDLMKLERRWLGCKTDRDRKEVIGDAMDLLKLYLPKADIKAKRGTLEWKVVIGKDSRPSRVVAKMYGVSHATVCQYRQGNYGRKSLLGLVPADRIL